MAEFKIRDKESGKIFSIREKGDSTKEQPEIKDEKISGYNRSDLSQKVIPQFAAGLQESQLGQFAENRLGIKPGVPRDQMPEPEGFAPWAARNVGKYGQDVVNSISMGGLTGAALKAKGIMQGATLLPRVGRTAIESAVAAQPFKYDDLKQRAIGTGIATVAGPVIGEGIGLAGKAGSFLLKEPAKAFKAFKLARNTRSIEEAVPKLGAEIQSATSSGSKAVADMRLSFRNKNIELGKQLSEAMKTGGRDIQEKLGTNLRKVSPEYGQRMSKIVSEAKGSLSVDDAAQIAQDTLNEMKSRNISNPDVEEILTKYIEELKSVKTSPLVDEYGRVIQTANRPATDTISISELSNKRTTVMSQLSPAGKGQGNYSQPDLAAIIFDKNMADRLSPLVPELKGLRGEYHQFKKLATEAYKIVRPKSGEYNTKAIEGLIKRVATGKASAGEIELAQAVEKGTTLLPGSGKFYADAEVIGKELNRIKEFGPTAIRQLQAKNQAIVDALKAKKVLAEADKRELGRAWTRLKVYGSLIGTGGAVGTYKAISR